jgi:hypothetical protein
MNMQARDNIWEFAFGVVKPTLSAKAEEDQLL